MVDVFTLWQHLQSVVPHAQSERHNAWLLRGWKRLEHRLRNSSTGRRTARRGQRNTRRYLREFRLQVSFSSLPEYLLKSTRSIMAPCCCTCRFVAWCWSSMYRNDPSNRQSCLVPLLALVADRRAVPKENGHKPAEWGMMPAFLGRRTTSSS